MRTPRVLRSRYEHKNITPMLGLGPIHSESGLRVHGLFARHGPHIRSAVKAEI